MSQSGRGHSTSIGAAPLPSRSTTHAARGLGSCVGQRAKAIFDPSAENVGWSSMSFVGGCVTCFSPVPSGLIVKTAPCACVESV
jgi:hypothetical protein